MGPKRQTFVEVSDDEEEEEPASQSQSCTQLTPSDREHLSGVLCNYLLLNETKKVPSKKADIRKTVLKEKGKYFNEVMAEASEQMKNVYGYQIVQLKKKDNYILVNSLKESEDLMVNFVTSNDEIKGLLTIILSAIFMSGGVMQEGTMREYLKNFSIDINSKAPHPVFGNIDKLLHQDLAKQCYLEIVLDKSLDPPCREYRWGERAHLELPKKQILELVCKVYGNNMRPEMWLSQWNVVQEESRNEASQLHRMND